jgi:curved DNA-binding protein CbpA
MPRKRFDPYAVLGVAPTATTDEIRRAYLRQVRVHHPDTRPTPQSMPFADEQLRRVLAAYALLRDPERRARYDRVATRDGRAAKHGPTAPGAPAETTNIPNSTGSVRIPGLTVRFRVKWLSG